jgi:hypothetical protein
MVTIGELLTLYHPQHGRLDRFEVIDVSGLTVRLRAQGAGYWSDADRLVECRLDQLHKYRSGIEQRSGTPKDLALRMKDRT